MSYLKKAFKQKFINSQQSTRAVAPKHNLSRWSVLKVPKKHKFDPYKIKLLQEVTLIEVDFDRRIAFCEIISEDYF